MSNVQNTSVKNMIDSYRETVRGCGAAILNQSSRLLGVTTMTRREICPLGQSTTFYLLPHDVQTPQGLRIGEMSLLGFRLVIEPNGVVSNKLVMDYDLWMYPQAGTRDPRKIDPRMPLEDRTKRSFGKGDVLLRALELFREMSRVARLINQDAAEETKLPVIPGVPQIMVATTTPPVMPSSFSEAWKTNVPENALEDMFRDTTWAPDTNGNTTGMYLSCYGAYASAPRGPLFEVHTMEEAHRNAVCLRIDADSELYFDNKTNMSNVPLDLTQRLFGQKPESDLSKFFPDTLAGLEACSADGQPVAAPVETLQLQS